MSANQQFSNNANSKITAIETVSYGVYKISVETGVMSKFAPLQLTANFQTITIKRGSQVLIGKMTANGNGGEAGISASLATDQAILDFTRVGFESLGGLEGTDFFAPAVDDEIYADATAEWYQSVNDLLFTA